jgi:hypothetical protein
VIPSDSNAEIKAGTVHGSISNDFGLPVRRGDYVGRDLAGQLGEGGARIKLGNVNGPITIKHAADGRPLSRATSLLAQNVKDKSDRHDDDDFDVEGSRSEARRGARDAAREAARAQLDAQRAQVESQRATMEARRAQLEAQKAQRQAQLESQRALAEAQRAQAEARAEAQRAQLEGRRAAREGQVEAQRAQLEAQREQRQALIEAQRARAEAQRAAHEARRIALAEASQNRIEAQRAARDAARAASSAAAIGTTSSLRLVERDSKNFKVSGTPNITARTFDGSITVHGWDKPEVQITINKRAASEQQMRGISLRTTQSNSDISVIATFDQNFSQKNSNLPYPNAVVSLDLYVPRSSMVRISSGDGRLELDGVNGNLDLNTGDGLIDVRDARGSLVAKTGDGRIQVENFDGNVQVRTGDGRIILGGRFAGLAAHTNSGSILLTVPSNYNATIETDAESVDNQGLSVTEETGTSRRLKRWKIGQGGTVLTLRTGEGRVFLRRAGQ